MCVLVPRGQTCWRLGLAYVHRCPEARLSLEAGLTYIGASKPPRHAARHLEATSTPKVDESGACLARRPRRTKMVTERYASMGCRRLAHDRILEYVYIHIYIYMYVCTYINISRAETVELRTWISQRSQRQLRPNGMLPDKYLETQTGSSRRGPWSLYICTYVCTYAQGCSLGGRKPLTPFF